MQDGRERKIRDLSPVFNARMWKLLENIGCFKLDNASKRPESMVKAKS